MARTGETSHKILSHSDLHRCRAEARASGRRVVHCHGCFDIVHPGHIRHLKFARALGDILMVSISGDTEVGKGTGRPLIPEELRAENLAELDCVDWVYIERRPTAAGLLGEIQPDIYVKGREYETNADPRFQAERDAVERSGGRVVFSSGDVVFSSTALIASMDESIDPAHHRLAQLLDRTDMQAEGLIQTLADIRGRRVVIVGEVIRDTYVFCDRPGVAHESPVMTLRPMERRSFDGGAAVLARHAAALGARPVLIAPLAGGDDPESAEFCRRMEREGIEVRPIATIGAMPEKQRFLVGTQKVMKVDEVRQAVLDTAAQESLVDAATDAMRGGVDAVILADFGLGTFSPGLTARVCGAVRPNTGVLAGDVSGRRHTLRAMRHMDLLCPSEDEVRDAFGLHGEALPSVVWRLLHDTRSRAAIVTMGSEGAVAFEPLPDSSAADGADPFRSRVHAEHLPALLSHALDPLGCGDTMLATASLALTTGAPLVVAAFLGSAAAATHAQRLGNPSLEPADLRRSILRLAGARLAYAGAEIKPIHGTRQAS